LGSSNGAYLSGVRLAAYRSNRLKDGDKIRLGQMVMHMRLGCTAQSLPK
jgi:predicted component of type VI protein secretion system